MGMEEDILALPAIQAGKGLWQNEHHEFDVYGHSVSMGEEMRKRPHDRDMIAAALMHDIGKPLTKRRKYKSGKRLERSHGEPYHTFFGHEKEGADLIRKMDSGFFTGHELEQERIAQLVESHFVPMQLALSLRLAKGNEEILVDRTIERMESFPLVKKEEILMMFECDQLAKGDAGDTRLMRRVLDLLR